MTTLDRRLAAYRPDLADVRLSGQVESARFVEGEPARIGAFLADVLAEPRKGSGMNTQFLAGEPVVVFERAADFSWVQSERDFYVGYVRTDTLGPRDPAPTHVVAVPRTFLYSGPDMKLPRAGYRSMGSEVAVVGHAETRGTQYAMLASGEAVIAGHLLELGRHAADWVAVAETLEHAPYLWGGTSGFGLDCSGLVQLAMRMAGMPAPRDSDMQAGSLGAPIEPGPDMAGLVRGDLVFWKGHVAIVTGPDAIIHANGHTMTVARESLSGAVERIGYLYGQPTGFRRP